MASHYTVIFDSCVFYPYALRDLMMQLSLTGLFRGRWTADIHQEWMRSVLRDRRDLTREHLERTRSLMDLHVEGCLVTDYQDLIPNLRLPDPDDRHVLAAAIKCGAQMIVTSNLKDFPADVLAKWGIEPQSPDDFVVGLCDLSPVSCPAVCEAVRKCHARRKNPACTMDAYLSLLSNQGLAGFTMEMKKHRRLLEPA